MRFFLENRGKESGRAEVCSGKVKIVAPLLSEICNVDNCGCNIGHNRVANMEMS